VRATSPPPALTVATAVIPLIAAILVPLAVPSAALAERWLRPVPGEVARSYSYSRATPFARGAHRGVDLAARPGTAVRAACSGRVIHAGPVAGHGRVVSVRCGGRRVSYLPLARLAVRAGSTIRAGAAIGTVAAGHSGLHLGVRREADRFGYEDPLALLASPDQPRTPAPLVVRRRPPRTAPRPVAARPSRRIVPRRVVLPRSPRPEVAPGSPRAVRRPTIAPGSPAAPATAPDPITPLVAGPRAVDPRADVAPWPVWAGVALLLAGAAGSGTVVLRRRHAARPPVSARASYAVRSPASTRRSGS
jgi:murein DD-endopeptidase MepM/ murein hydrolase activator NlpD